MIERFLEFLIAATAKVRAHYFQLPVADREDTIYRERVYSYELYHQIQMLLEEDQELTNYVLSGEIDKQGHPIIRQCAPDLLFHVPRDMGSNLVVVEVKPANAKSRGIRKDLDTLRYFLTDAPRYQLGVQLVYGNDERAFSRFVRRVRRLGLPQLHLYWHRQPGEPARRII